MPRLQSIHRLTRNRLAGLIRLIRLWHWPWSTLDLRKFLWVRYQTRVICEPSRLANLRTDLIALYTPKKRNCQRWLLDDDEVYYSIDIVISRYREHHCISYTYDTYNIVFFESVYAGLRITSSPGLGSSVLDFVHIRAYLGHCETYIAWLIDAPRPRWIILRGVSLFPFGFAKYLSPVVTTYRLARETRSFCSFFLFCSCHWHSVYVRTCEFFHTLTITLMIYFPLVILFEPNEWQLLILNAHLR